jgi:hypothetical protein
MVRLGQTIEAIGFTFSGSSCTGNISSHLPGVGVGSYLDTAASSTGSGTSTQQQSGADSVRSLALAGLHQCMNGWDGFRTRQATMMIRS